MRQLDQAPLGGRLVVLVIPFAFRVPMPVGMAKVERRAVRVRVIDEQEVQVSTQLPVRVQPRGRSTQRRTEDQDRQERQQKREPQESRLLGLAGGSESHGGGRHSMGGEQ